jgi:hypothetical protein
MDNTPRVTRATMLDREPCGVYSLKALSEQLLASTREAEVRNS